jgi:hypothetical protein
MTWSAICTKRHNFQIDFALTGGRPFVLMWLPHVAEICSLRVNFSDRSSCKGLSAEPGNTLPYGGTKTFIPASTSGNRVPDSSLIHFHKPVIGGMADRA